MSHYVHSLKEMVFLPLLYPEVFARFKMNPPRGVLLYGAPGTGKTPAASFGRVVLPRGRRGLFHMRKGADVLSKWVGESERQLRLLFAEAQKRQPAIIFFDEIDGLAPVRSSKTDQIHNSIVATLLALMDGLDSRGRVVVLGATNRVDAIDGALRRPGRFDRELAFPLPKRRARVSRFSRSTRARGRNPAVAAAEQPARCVGTAAQISRRCAPRLPFTRSGGGTPRFTRATTSCSSTPGRSYRAAWTSGRRWRPSPPRRIAARRRTRGPRPLRQPLMGPALGKAVEATFLAFPRRRWRPTPTKTPPVHPVHPSRRPPRWCSTSTTSTTTTRTTAWSCSRSSTAARVGSKVAPAVVPTPAVPSRRGPRRRRRFIGRLRVRGARDGGARVPQLPARARQPRLLLHGPCGSGQRPRGGAAP